MHRVHFAYEQRVAIFSILKTEILHLPIRKAACSNEEKKNGQT